MSNMLPDIAQLEFNTTAEESDSSTELGTSYQYDFNTGEFVLIDGKLVTVSDIEAIKVWVEKVLRTERFVFEIYTRDDGNEYGTTLEDLIGSVLPRAFVESELKREITEAVTRHPKIESISNLTASQEGSWLEISFEINLYDGTTINQEVAVNG
ncbi:MAG: DUF2634 domain-containing protein [Syntrophomonadaceae bacterium]|nr:DUF2634 domain-containing protein [Syntrophomonadaceae bacterium]